MTQKFYLGNRISVRPPMLLVKSVMYMYMEAISFIIKPHVKILDSGWSRAMD